MKASFRQTVWAAALACAMGAAAAGAHAANNLTVTAAQRAAALKAAQEGVAVSELAPGAPASYQVKRGDTLWGISGMFLRTPWRWPALWGMNLNEVSNPHLIYPGEILHLEVVNGRARLTKTPGQGQGEIRLSPNVRVDEQLSALSTIPIGAIRPFLTRPMLVDESAFASSGTVLATEESRLNVGAGGRIYAANLPAEAKTGSKFTIYRAGRSIADPENGSVLGIEAVYLGEAVVVRVPDGQETLTTLKVSSSSQEIGRGDRLLSVPSDLTFQYVPRAPQQDVQARVVMMHDGRSGSSLLGGASQGRPYDSEGGPLSIVVINRGSAAGLEPGHVLQLARRSHTIQERSSLGFRNGDRVQGPVQFPAESFGAVMVFKAFNNVAYGIVLEASAPVMPGDLAQTHEVR